METVATQECYAADTGYETHPVTVYRQRSDLSLCSQLLWNVTLEHTTTHFNVLGRTGSGNPPLILHRPSIYTSGRPTLCCCHVGSQSEAW